MRTPLTLLLAFAALLIGGCGGDDTSETAATTPGEAATAATTPADASARETPAVATDGAGEPDATCREVDAPSPKSADTPKPTGKLDLAKTYTVVMKTSCGEIRITLDQERNPTIANAFATLVRANYFDGVAFHRVVKDWVIQGGDPAGDGTGGPPWQVVQAPPSDAKYERGVVAMAKTGTDPAGAAGSQFFIVVSEDAGLPPEYAIAGRVSGGYKVVDAISDLGGEGSASDGPPTRPVIIRKAYIEVE